MIIMELTNHLLIGFEACFAGKNLCLVVNLVKAIAMEVRGPREKPTTVVLLNGQVTKPPSKYLCLYR